MALTSSQISSKLFKKSLGAGETLVTRQFFEEPRLGRELVLYDQIWSQSNLIPNTAPVLSPGASAGVVQYFQLDSLSHVSGAVNLSYFSANLIDSIPFNYGDGTYNYQLFKNDGVTPISFGEGDWIIDNTAGLLTFYGTLPSGVSSALPPKVSFYKYVGTKGFGSGSGIGTIIGVTAGSGLTGGGTAGFISLDVNLKQNSGLTFSGDSITVELNNDYLIVGNDNKITVKNPYVGKNIYVDAIYGSNSVGEKYNFYKRYQTILAAETVATDGDTIYVMSSSQSYTDNGIGAIFSNGTTMNYYFERGAKIDIRLLGPTSNIDIFVPDGANLNVMGYGEFIATGCVGLIFGSSSLNLEMLRCLTDNQSSNASAVFEMFSSTNTLIVKCHDKIESTSGNILTCCNRDQTAFIESNETISSGGVVRTFFNGGTNKSFIKFKSKRTICNANNLAGGYNFDGIYVNDGAKIILESSFYKTSTNPLSVGLYNYDGETHLHGDYTIDNNIASMYGGKVYHYGQIIGSQSYRIFGGDVYLKNRLESTASYSVFKSGGNLVLDGASLISSTWSIYATGSQDVICYSGAANQDISDDVIIRVNPLNINNYVI